MEPDSSLLCSKALHLSLFWTRWLQSTPSQYFFQVHCHILLSMLRSFKWFLPVRFS